MDTWKKIVQMVQTFAYIMTGTTISTALFITIFIPKLEFSIFLLWQIVIISAVCTLGNLFYYKDSLTKRQIKVRIICHYLYINTVVLGGGLLFDWFSLHLLLQVLFMLLLIAVVYVIIMIVNFHQEMKMAESLNRELRKRYPSREE